MTGFRTTPPFLLSPRHPWRHGAGPGLRREGGLTGSGQRPISVQRVLGALTFCVAFAVVLSACAAGSTAGPSRSSGQFRFASATAPGTVIPAAARKPAAAMKGTLISGGTFELASHQGRVVLINFWASWCAPCVTESPMLNTVYQTMKGRGVDFVGVDIKDERQAAQSFITDKHMTYPMVYDEPARTALQLGVPIGGLPITALIDRAGRVAGVYLGQVYRPDLQTALQKLAAETP